MDEDVGIIRRHLAGDEDAQEELVMKYQKQIYAFLYRMTRDVEEAKDLTQDTFIKAIQGLRRFRMESSFKTWLYRIALNTGLNHLRRNSRRETELEESTAAGQPEALSEIIEREKRDHIRRSLHELPERQRLTIILRAYEGLSCSETADVLGCSEGAVKAHYHNGVKRLRSSLKERGYEIRT